MLTPVSTISPEGTNFGLSQPIEQKNFVGRRYDLKLHASHVINEAWITKFLLKTLHFKS